MEWLWVIAWVVSGWAVLSIFVWLANREITYGDAILIFFFGSICGGLFSAIILGLVWLVIFFVDSEGRWRDKRLF